MSQDYVQGKIKRALELTRGNATQARQQIIAWCAEDPKLLQALTRPHMTGIVAHAVNRVMSGKTEPQVISPPPESAVAKGEFGMEILKTIAGGDTAQFGRENNGRPLRKKGVSQSHIDAIQKMIKESQKKS